MSSLDGTESGNNIRSDSGGLVRGRDGTSIAYDAIGQGPPVLFLHGITNSRRAWDPITQLLGRDVTCVQVDLRGHGDSSQAKTYGMSDVVSDVDAVVQGLDLKDPFIVGHSLGGTAAAIYAAFFPVRGAVIVDQSLRVGDFARLVQPFRDRLRGEACMEAVLDIERGLGIESLGEVGAMEQRVLAFPPDVVRGFWTDLLDAAPEDLTKLVESVLPKIRVPVLALHGSQPPSDYEGWLTQLVPTATVEVWAGKGHFLHLVDPSRFAARVRRFLDEVHEI